jgi:hypothetical protein
MTHDEWLAEGERRFGGDVRDWKFVCPVCGEVQSIRDFEEKTKLKREEIRTVIAFSCIGRWTEGPSNEMGSGKRPCNYAGGGLFRLNPVAVEHEGQTLHVFAFAEAEAAAEPPAAACVGRSSNS